MFIGRERELAVLQEAAKSHKFEMIPIWGRRRIGKTRLLEEFSRDYQTIFFTADLFGDEANLAGLSQAIYLLTNDEIQGGVYPSFEVAFEAVANYAAKTTDPVIFILDEFPYIADDDGRLMSVLQRVIDKKYLHCTNLTLILTGSLTSFMEKQVMGVKSPLYGRRTGQLKLGALTFKQAAAFVPKYDLEDQLTVYGITGGVPLYLAAFDPEKSLKDNLISHVLRPNTLLYEEPRNLLLQEVRSPERYNAIIAAVASGATEMSEIAQKSRVEPVSTVMTYINTLIEMDIIEKKLPLSAIGKNKPIFVVKDSFFRFWYRYIPKYRNLLEQDKAELVWPLIEADLPQFVSIVFEEYCRQWVDGQNGQKWLPFLVQQPGAWWGRNPLVHSGKAPQEEVDVVAEGIEKNQILLGECKWRNELTSLEVAEKLVARSLFFPYQKKLLVIFSKAGFSEKLRKYGEAEGILLWTFEEMVARDG